MKKLILMVFLMILVTGCVDNKIDSSTDEKFESSINTMKNSLSDEKKKKFETAIHAIADAEFYNTNVFETASNLGGVERKIKDKLHGKTVDEVIAEGDLVIAEQKRREQERTLAEIEEIKTEITKLEEKRSNEEKSREGLKKFIVVRSRFYFQKSTFIGYPIIELTVKNETKHAVSRAYFHGVLASPGRSIPWVKGTFGYGIPGGLEPGEQATWKFTPMSGYWDSAPRDRKDMIFTVTTTCIDGADEKSIYDIEFSESEWDKERFEDLKEKLAKYSSSKVLYSEESK